MSTKFFISYSRSDTAAISMLREKIKPHSSWVDVEDIGGGDYRPQVDEAILQSNALILVISPASVASAEVTYEWQFALGAGLDVIPVIVQNAPIPSRLEKYTRFDLRVDAGWEMLKGCLDRYNVRELVQKARMVTKEAKLLESESTAYQTNIAFRRVIGKSIRDLGEQLSGTTKNQALFTAPASQYPHYLIDLQNAGAVVKAVALVDKDEFFWQQKLGPEIRTASDPESVRTFVFFKENDLKQAIDEIRSHAKVYHVYAIDAVFLNKEYNFEDFAIIQLDDSKMLVKFDETRLDKLIRFSANPRDILRYEERVDQIRVRAELVPRNMGNSPEEIEAFIRRVFRRRFKEQGES